MRKLETEGACSNVYPPACNMLGHAGACSDLSANLLNSRRQQIFFAKR